MGKHFSEPTGTGTNKGKAALVALVVVVVALVGAGACWALAQRGPASPEEPSQEAPSEEAPKEPTDSEEPDDSGDDSADPVPSAVPFSIEGVSADGPVTEASSDASQIALSGEWSFGGDYAKIGSYPIDEKTVFGSSASDPDDMSSYVASTIGPAGDTALEEAQVSEPFFEPQDGTGTADRLVWRSTELSNLPTTGTDNWRLQTWSPSDGAVVLGTAEELNSTSDTPMLDGEVVPTANESHAFFASNRAEGDAWVPSVLAYDLANPGSAPEVLGTGCYPAATDDGALWAGDSSAEDGGGVLLDSLYRWSGSGSDSDKVFSLSSEGGSWGISGVWSSDSASVVAFSSQTDASQGCYVGIWSSDFASFRGWLHASSPRVVGSLNNDWFVWGSGSQADNTEMYAYNLNEGTLGLLGNAPGYSRPAVARDNDAVLVPVSDGYNPVSFKVGTLA